MKCHVSIAFLLTLILLVVSSVLAGPVQYGVDMSLRQIAHDAGLTGRELAELLGLEGSVDKDAALAELGITQQQLETVLDGIPRPEPGIEEESTGIDTGMTLQEAAHTMGMTGKELAHVLGLPVDVDKQSPLKELGVTEEKLQEATKHAEEGEGGLSWLKYPFWILVCTLAVFLLLKGRASKALYLSTLSLSLALTGFLLGKPPNPMESVVKLFKAAVGIYPDIGVKVMGFAFFCLLAVVGNKIICGWGCPFGALQELLFETPMGSAVKRLRKKKLPFKWTNMIRTVTFAVFVLLIFGLLGSQKGFVLYHYINPFNLFDFDLAMVSIMISVPVFVLASFLFYRGFCQCICPFGIISWLLEKISLTRVTINRIKCTGCMACVQACPLEAMKGRMGDRSWPADCFSCARCLRACSYDALDYKTIWQADG